MTPELQRAMAQYEEARSQYRKAVLASLNGTSNGNSIRQAIREFQHANAALNRLQATPPTLPPAPHDEPVACANWGSVLKLLKAG